MGKIPLLLSLLAWIPQAVSATPAYTREQLESKLSRFELMQGGGLVMAGVGAAIMAGGLIKAVKGDAAARNATSNEEHDVHAHEAFAGFLYMMTAVPLIGGGVVFTAVGTHKVRVYEGLLDRASVYLDYRPDRQGVRLAVTF